MMDRLSSYPYRQFDETQRTPVRRWIWISLLAGAFLFLAWSLVTNWLAPIEATDINQHRVNTALPAPTGVRQIRQSFVAKHDGLVAVDLLFVRFQEEEPGGQIGIQLFADDGRQIASELLESQRLSHNQNFTLSIPRQPQSAGEKYTLLITGQDNSSVSVWGYDVDVYDGGELRLTGAETTAQDLRFSTRYRLTPADAIGTLGELAGANLMLLILAVAYMIMPGLLLLVLTRRWTQTWDMAARWGVALAIGVALWPILWTWLALLDIHWTAQSMWRVFWLGWIATGLLWIRSRMLPIRHEREIAGLRFYSSLGKLSSTGLSWHHLVLFILFVVALSVRLLAVRDLSFPLWVDGSRHGLISAVMVQNGQVIDDYEPYLPVSEFPYHYGFHTIAAGLVLMTGIALPKLLLILGQLINALIIVTVYGGAYLMTRRRNVGLIAAFLVALPFFFPGYYVTWGRMTQLTAMLVLPVAMAWTWRLIRGARIWRSGWWLVGIVSAGLFLIHFRIFLLFIAFAGLVWLVSIFREWRWLLLSAGTALALIAPRIVRLIGASQTSSIAGSAEGYNDFPVGYLNTGWERAFLWLGLGCIVLAIIAGFRSKRWAVLPLLLAAWVGLVGLLLSGNRLGLPETFLINLNSAYISLFLPLALLLAITADQLLRWLKRRSVGLQLAGYFVAGVAGMALVLFGVRQQITIVNQQTVLGHPADETALRWLNASVPASAKIAVSSWLWLGNTWAGSDGGAWITPVTGRRSTTPPVDYIYSPDLASTVNAFNEDASSIENWSDPSAAAWLREQGVTHVYVGAQGGFLDPSALLQNPALELVYSLDGVLIFAVG